MLARLQRAVLLGFGAAAALWAIGWIVVGSPYWALFGALAVMFGYAVVLGAEFVLLGIVNRGDPVPSATAWQLLSAWWGETCTAALVFGWRQPFCVDDVADWLPARAPRGRRAVVLVHGLVCNRAFWNPWMEDLRGADVPYVAVNLEPVFAPIESYAEIIDDAVRRAAGATGLAPVVVAHSMGGLAVRAWLGRCGCDDRVHRVITIGTPHRGTWLGRFAATANGQQMQLDSKWHRALVEAESVQRQARFTCFYSHCDNIVFPSSNATLPGADNRHVSGAAHVDLAFRREVFDEVLRWVESDVSVRP